MDIYKILGCLVIFIHTIPFIICLVIIGLIWSGYNINKKILFIVLAYETLVVIGWSIFGICILTALEKRLFGVKEKTVNNERTKNPIVIYVEDNLNLPKNFVYYLLTSIHITTIATILFHITERNLGFLSNLLFWSRTSS